MKPILIVETGSTFPDLIERRGDYERWFREGMSLADDEVKTVSAHRGEALPDWRELSGVVVTGSAAMVSHREPWSEQTGQWLTEVISSDVPLLAVCYGHQLVAQTLGGVVGPNPRGREMGTVELELTEAGTSDLLFAGHDSPFEVQSTHVESVLELPPGALRLAGNDHDPNQAFSLGNTNWCLQFHPEFDADVLRTYVDRRRQILTEEGLDPSAIDRRIHDTTMGPEILRRFEDLARTYSALSV